MRVSIHITTKDRHSEVGLLLQCLRTQTFQDWDLVILDDQSGSLLQTCGFFNSILTRIKLEGHRVKLLRNSLSQGVCYARNELIKEDKFGNELTFRCDDDVILQPDYIQRLVDVIVKDGYDIASGVVPLIMAPENERENRFLFDFINEHKLDKEGNLIMNKDECGHAYLEEGVYPTHQFRTNALYRSVIHEKVKYPSELSRVGFREELWFSFQAILAGYDIGVDVQAKALHFQTSSGGCRDAEYNQKVQLDEETTRKWIKRQFNKHGDFVGEYYEKFN